METVGVVGAGTMGRGIAFVAALSGRNVVLQDPFPAALEGARAELEKTAQGAVKRGKLDAASVPALLGRIRTVAEIGEEWRGIDLAVEAVPEDLALKKRVFAQLDRVAPPRAILASNTSSLPISEMAAETSRPERVIGMHFFNPVPASKLVEIIPTGRTSPETVRACEAVSRSFGKETVVVRESPGFVTTRVNALIGCEAFRAWEGGAKPEDVDRAVRRELGWPMGPFELADLVGLDVRLNIVRYLHSRLGERFRPSAKLEHLVAEGRLGRKTGRGVYDYAAPPDLAAAPEGTYRERPDSLGTRFAAIVGNEAFRMWEEGIATPADIDKAVRLGLGHPVGPLELVDRVGREARIATLNLLASKFGDAFRPPPLFK